MMMCYISQALLLLMQEMPYSKISVSDVTAKAGVNRSTYYRHFYTKEDIIRFYFKEIMQEYLDKFSSLASTDSRLYYLTMFDVFYSHRIELLTIHKEQLSYILIDVLNEYFKIFDMEEHRQFTTAYHIGGIYNCMLLWFSHDMRETPQIMTDIALSMNIDAEKSLQNAMTI